jgi:hypothetical protein
MPAKCVHCAIDPSSHSLIRLREENGTIVYYTKPSSAKMYYDSDSIISHYKAELPLDKEWVWLFDAEGFGLKHLLHVDVGIKMAKLITSEYKDNLVKIQIINSNAWVDSVYSIVKPFLSDRIIKTIEFIKQNK